MNRFNSDDFYQVLHYEGNRYVVQNGQLYNTSGQAVNLGNHSNEQISYNNSSVTVNEPHNKPQMMSKQASTNTITKPVTKPSIVLRLTKPIKPNKPRIKLCI